MSSVTEISSVLFFSCPRSEGWPHHGRTFSTYPCPLSFWWRNWSWRNWWTKKMNGTIRYQLRLRRDQQIVSGWTKWEQHWRRWKGIKPQWKENVESKGMRVNMNKTKVMISGERQMVWQKAARWPRRPGKRLYVRTVKHVSWIKMMPWTVANGERW